MHSQESVHGRRCAFGAGPGVGRGDTELLERGVGAEPRWLRYRGPIHSGGLRGEGTQDTGTPGLEVPLPGQPRRFPPRRSWSQHRVSGSPAPSMTSPAGLLSVVPSRAHGFSQPIQPGCGEMWPLRSSPGLALANTHLPAGLGSVKWGCSKGTHSRRELTSQRDTFLKGTHFPPPQHHVCRVQRFQGFSKKLGMP